MKLKVLGLGSGILVLLAVAAFAVNQWIATPPGDGRVGKSLLGGVDPAQVRRVEITGADTQVTLTSEDGSQWRVVEQDGFPVDPKKIKGLLLKLSSEKVAHKVTDNPEHLADLSLLTREENGGAWEKGKTAHVLRILSGDGNTLLELLLGGDRRGQSATASGGAYVRYGGEPAAFLVSEAVAREFRPRDWIDTKVLSLDEAQTLKALRVARAGQPAVQLTRATAGGPWQMAGLTAAQLSQESVKRVTALYARLDVFAVRPGNTPAAETGRRKTGAATLELFDGRRFQLDIGEAAADTDLRYLTIRAELAPDVADAALKAQVEAFNERFAGRLLGVYDWDGERMLQAFDDYRAKDAPQQK